MKVYLATLAVLLLATPAAARTGNIHGTESRGAPFNSSYIASHVDPHTGYTRGYTARSQRIGHVKVLKSKKKRPSSSWR